MRRSTVLSLSLQLVFPGITFKTWLDGKTGRGGNFKNVLEREKKRGRNNGRTHDTDREVEGSNPGRRSTPLENGGEIRTAGKSLVLS